MTDMSELRTLITARRITADGFMARARGNERYDVRRVCADLGGMFTEIVDALESLTDQRAAALALAEAEQFVDPADLRAALGVPR